MKLFKFAVTSLAMIAVTSVTPKAQAYDEDTHFYGTYAMARFSGLRHEPSLKLALSAQWMDESYISDPTSMILMPMTGVKKRRLLHFPSSRVVGKLNATAQKNVLGFDKVTDVQKKFIDGVTDMMGIESNFDSINFVTETQEDHPFASELFMDGMRAGDLMMAGTSLHVIEDSFAHAGTPAEQGHAAFWHWPDRPFASPEKYFRMTKAVFSAMVALRAQMPQEALDCSIRVPSTATVPNCQQSVSELTKAYAELPQVSEAVLHDTLKDPEYVRNALTDFYQRAVQVKYVKMSEAQFKTLLDGVKLDGKTDAFTALEQLIGEATRQQITKKADLMDVRLILTDMGRLRTKSSMEVMDYIDSYGIDSSALSSLGSEGLARFVHVMAHELLKWTVPAPLNDTHRMEIEDDKSPVRKKEMEIRVARMRAMVKSLFGVNLEFVENNSKDVKGFTQEVRMEKAAEPVLASKPGVVVATFSLQEKNRFDNMIFSYLFPGLTREDLGNMAALMENIAGLSDQYDQYKKEIALVDASDRSVTGKLYDRAMVAKKYTNVNGNMMLAISTMLKTSGPMLKNFIRATLDTHVVPSEDNYFYRNARLFSQYRSEGKVKMFLSETDAWPASTLLQPPARVTPAR